MRMAHNKTLPPLLKVITTGPPTTVAKAWQASLRIPPQEAR